MFLLGGFGEEGVQKIRWLTVYDLLNSGQELTFIKANSSLPKITDNMKSKFLTFALLVAVVVSVYAQALKKVETIKEEEVPAAVRVAFTNDFGPIPGDGSWTVNFNVVSDGEKMVAKPTWYTFRKGNRQDKIEVRYSPDGKLEHAKGLKKLADS